MADKRNSLKSLFIERWVCACFYTSFIVVLSRMEAVKWHPPDHPLYKLNVDAVVLKELNATEMGMVVRDWEGNVLAAMTKRFLAPLATLEAEAKSMEVAVQFAWEMGFREVVCETDSLGLYQMLLGTTEAPTCIETIVTSILLLTQNFHCISFNRVKRQGNKPAHILAQFARHIGDFVVWLEETPSQIEHACESIVFPKKKKKKPVFIYFCATLHSSKGMINHVVEVILIKRYGLKMAWN